MLTRINNKQVRGENFTVSIIGIHRVKYSEDQRVAFLEIEGGTGPNNEIDWVIYSETLKGWEAPHDNEELPRRERDRLITNISKSLELLGMPHRIV
ncbi:MAG TPA: Imm74 family immunity protein [Terriglobia bacterium]|nr:Imm74 family immunity protein [Terriglobia bacterium]